MPVPSVPFLIPFLIRILHSDWLGSSRLSTLYGNRTLAYDAAYAPYGETYGTAGSQSDIDFTGMRPDTQTGLYDFPAREYSPSQGRWISPDPAGLSAANPGNPQSWNRYAYVMNNPLSFVDPTGLFCVWDNRGISEDGGWDSADDPNTGDADKCGLAGGNWFDGSPADYGLSGDWSDQQSSIAAQWLDQQTNYTLYTQATAKIDSDAPNNPIRLFLPPNALTCSGMGKQFYAPPQFNLNQVVVAGQAGGRFNLSAMNSAVGHFGTFDYQRVGTPSSFTFYSGYTPVSNIDVGACLYGAGFSQSLAGMISNTFASLFSKNAGDPNQATYRNLGYQMAAGKGSYSCSAILQ